MTSDPQQCPDDYTAGTTTESVTRTISVKLETSSQKNESIRQGIAEFQQMAAFMAGMVPSYPEAAWTPHNTTMYRQVTREFPGDDRTVKATIAREAQQKVAEAFQSWRSNGKPGNRPQFGDGDYLRLSHQDLSIVENDRGWGLKASFIPHKAVWFHIHAGAFQRDFLERITEGEDDASAGSAELYLEDDGSLTCNLTVSWEVEVYEPAEVVTVVGVDLNDDPLYAAAVVGEDEVLEVDLQSGAEYRHHRERLKSKRAEAMEEGDLRGIKESELTYDRYTDHITNVASRRIIDVAGRHTPCVVHLENLTHYRETAKDPLHDWPFAEIQRKIAYKATEAGIPISFVDPRYTSITCRRCGQTNPEYREEREFACRQCGYEVHADVNAAINIATGITVE